MQFVSLSRAEYAQAVADADRLFLPQLPEYGKVVEDRGEKVEYVGVRRDGAVVASALIHYQPWKKFFLRALIVSGPTLDWKDEDVVRFFFANLIAHVKKNKRVLSLRVSPNVPAAFYRDVEKVEDAPIGKAINAFLTGIGFDRLKKEFYDQPDIPIRFIYTKDIADKSFEEIADSLSKTMRRQVKHVGRYGVEVKILGSEDWDVFQELYDSSRERTDMAELSGSSIGLYRHLMDELGPERAILVVAYAHPETYLKEIEDNLSDLRTQIAQKEEPPLTTKKERALKELNSQANSLQRQLTEVKDLADRYGDNVPFAGVLAFRSGNEILQLLRGFNKEFTTFNRDYPIESALLRWAADRDFKVYNTYGVSGILDDSAPDANVIAYKRKLDGNMEEFIGTYMLPVSPLARVLGALA